MEFRLLPRFMAQALGRSAPSTPAEAATAAANDCGGTVAARTGCGALPSAAAAGAANCACCCTPGGGTAQALPAGGPEPVKLPLLLLLPSDRVAAAAAAAALPLAAAWAAVATAKWAPNVELALGAAAPGLAARFCCSCACLAAAAALWPYSGASGAGLAIRSARFRWVVGGRSKGGCGKRHCAKVHTPRTQSRQGASCPQLQGSHSLRTWLQWHIQSPR